MAENNVLKCRFCGATLNNIFADLGVQPVCESYLEKDQLNKAERFYPLIVYVCEKCFLVQLKDALSPEEIFDEYAYFSSHSKGWMTHVENYSEMITNKLGLDNRRKVVEIGSNDGYLLQFFSHRNIPVLGVEPARNVAKNAIENGIPTFTKFFGTETSRELLKLNGQADLLIANNILAQVPDINGFVEGLKVLLKPSGIITVEFHHLLNLIKNNQFDTICHERFSYLSLFVVEKILASHGLTIFDVEEFPTHGGSLRIFVRHNEDQSKPITSNVDKLRKKEKASGLEEIRTYRSFSDNVRRTKRNILGLLIKIRNSGKSVVAYGAHAEAHTFLNYCGLTSDFLDYAVDRNPAKQKKFIAGVRVPIFNPDKIEETKPSYLLILPWSIKKEIMSQLSYIGNWGGKFIMAIPKLALYDSNALEIEKEKEEIE